jgi:arginine/serine-rich splicing factor 4/5/6
MCLGVLAVTSILRYGSLSRVEIKRNYAFVEFKDINDAKEAQRSAHTAKLNGRTITVEFVEGQKDRDRGR